ncbi:MAG: PspA/IM30 family protein [Deltaproteobacteria bacterium]|nr:PspA/IM30 family protein [Deltaproteobacteria bacterium]MBW2399750.1 PspA/IM30 family protein [Deltaproteobacteria bacterium]MBW2665373.1 PspA/IM30 family protein [Deltaproteobacteria bacterium]
MSIRFTQRLSRLIRADAHGIIESLEDRALLLKQHLREAELELQRKRARIATLDDEAQRLTEDAARLDRAAERLDDDTRLALEGGRADLARFALRRLLPLQREADALRERIVAIRAERERLEPRLVEQAEEFEILEQRIRERLAAESRTEPAFGSPLATAAADEEVEMELLRRTQPARADR